MSRWKLRLSRQIHDFPICSAAWMGGWIEIYFTRPLRPIFHAFFPFFLRLLFSGILGTDLNGLLPLFQQLRTIMNEELSIPTGVALSFPRFPPIFARLHLSSLFGTSHRTNLGENVTNDVLESTFCSLSCHLSLSWVDDSSKSWQIVNC